MSGPPHTRTVVVCISYCSHERPFIRAALRQSLVFARLVVVAVGQRLFSGQPEDEDHVAAMRAEFPDVGFVRYAVGDDELDTPVVLHNRSREAALQEVSRLLGADVDVWALLLDGDEVPRGAVFKTWWTGMQGKLSDEVAFKMANFWYFMHPHVRAERLEDSVVLLHLRHLTPGALRHPRERDGVLIEAATCTRLSHTERMVVAACGEPMFHHFSWVRRRDALISKVTSWGHAGDRSDWRELVEKGLQELAEGKLPREFVHGYVLRRIPGLPEEVAPEMDQL